MAPKQLNSCLFIKQGHIVTKKELLPHPVDRKGKTSKRVHFERNVIREVSGFAPYEKRIDALLKVGKDKRALKLAKRKLCTYESLQRESSALMRGQR
ncbi:hypothetical protein CUMW_016260 [Citrus unshiu]|nr:hypothetical protein CUMW_016260 [Citrus unshiu]